MGHLVISMIMTSVMHTVNGCLYVECVCMCVRTRLDLLSIPRPVLLYPHSQICVRVHRDWCFEAFVGDTRSMRRPADQCSGKASVWTAQEVALRIAALAHQQEKPPRGATCPGRRGKVFFVSSVYVRVLQSARFGYRQTEMKRNIQNNQLTTAASQDQSQKPQQEYVSSNLPV